MLVSKRLSYNVLFNNCQGLFASSTMRRLYLVVPRACFYQWVSAVKVIYLNPGGRSETAKENEWECPLIRGSSNTASETGNMIARI